MNEITSTRTPELIGAEIRMYVDAGRRVTLLCGIEIGRRLKEAKEMLPHGEWLPWLERETEFSTSSAARYMQAFEEYGSNQLGLFGPETNFPALGNLSITKALRLLAIPEEEREIFAEEHDVEHMSTRELDKALKEREDRIKALENDLAEAEEGRGLAIAELEEKIDKLRDDAEKGKAALKEKGELEEMLEIADLKVKELRDQIKELETRPVEVAVERDEKAIEEAVTAAKASAAAEWAEKMQTLQADLEKANAQKDKLKAKVDKAGAAADEKIAAAEQETARIRQELENTKRQLKMADADVTAFGIHFTALQQELNQALAALKKLADRDIVTAGKLNGAVAQVLKGAKAVVNELEQRAAKAPMPGQTEMGG